MGGDTNTYGKLRDQFVAAQKNVALIEHHNLKIAELNQVLEAENARHEQLLAQLVSEQRDVEKLEKFSLKRLSAKMGDGIEVALEREKLEAQAAADAVTECGEHRSLIRGELDRLGAELSEVGDNAEAERNAAQTELESYVRKTYGDTAEELNALDQKVSETSADLVEVDEAVRASDVALTKIAELAQQLSKAKSMSGFDMFGGGMLVSMHKRDLVKVSSEKSRAASHALDLLNKELGDTSLGGVNAALDDALSNEVFDVWFDNIFTDAKVHGRINDALK